MLLPVCIASACLTTNNPNQVPSAHQDKCDITSQMTTLDHHLPALHSYLWCCQPATAVLHVGQTVFRAGHITDRVKTDLPLTSGSTGSNHPYLREKYGTRTQRTSARIHVPGLGVQQSKTRGWIHSPCYAPVSGHLTWAGGIESRSKGSRALWDGVQKSSAAYRHAARGTAAQPHFVVNDFMICRD